jgi:hypothetical protein
MNLDTGGGRGGPGRRKGQARGDSAVSARQEKEGTRPSPEPTGAAWTLAQIGASGAPPITMCLRGREGRGPYSSRWAGRGGGWAVGGGWRGFVASGSTWKRRIVKMISIEGKIYQRVSCNTCDVNLIFVTYFFCWTLMTQSTLHKRKEYENKGVTWHIALMMSLMATIASPSSFYNRGWSPPLTPTISTL